MNQNYTILVNSTDSYKDCWLPFFKLFSKFWPGCKQKIILNTEKKGFCYPGLDIQCSKVCNNSSSCNLAWGECLIRCLEIIPTEVILYLQEDYFFNAPVKTEKINKFVEIMLKKNISIIRLFEGKNSGPWHRTDNPLLWEVDQKSKYRLSLQAGLWKKNSFKYYLRKNETPWQFEKWGSERAHRVEDSIFGVNRDLFNNKKGQIISYEPTGIVRGKWNKKAVFDLFKQNNIEIDFKRRGFNI